MTMSPSTAQHNCEKSISGGVEIMKYQKYRSKKFSVNLMSTYNLWSL